MAYTNVLNLYSLYGKVNIRKWADLDGDKNNDDIDNRIDARLVDAEDYVNSRLIQGKYDAPFTGTAPKIVTYITTLYAGILLYESSRVAAGSKSMREEVSRQRQQFNMYMKQILSGQLLLANVLSGEALETNSATHPIVVEDEETVISEPSMD